MEALFGHALVQPRAATGEGQAEDRAAKALGVQLLDSAHTLPALRTWRARSQDGKSVALVMLAGTVTPAERDRFALAAAALQAAGSALTGVLPVRQLTMSRDAFVTDLWTIGTARDLPALKWPLRRRVEFVAEITRALSGLHAAGVTHGCLSADNVLLDDDLRPVLSEVALVDVRALASRKDAGPYDAYSSPELRHGNEPREPTPGDDIYSVGQLLHELTDKTEGLPEQVTAIVHRCMSRPQARYADADELLAALHMAIEAIAVVDDARSSSGSAVEARASKKEIVGAAPRPIPAFGVSSSSPTRPWKPPVALGMFGLLLAAASLAAAALLGGTNDALRALLAVALPLGAALATTLAPGLARAPLAGRIVLAGGVASMLVLLDPLSPVFGFAIRKQMGSDASARRRAVAEIVRLGSDFRGVSLAGADLTRVDLGGADLRGVNLTGADLTGAVLFGAEVDGTRFDSAQLAGADLTGTRLELALVGSARCDDGTRFPSGFRCAGGRVVRGASPAPP